MTVRKKHRGTLAVGLVAGPLALLVAGVPAAMAAPSGTVTELTNTETIQARMDASGKVTEARVYEQIAVNGDGQVEIVNPVSTKGLRNLDGFSGFKVEGDRMVATVDVKGRKRLRTVSDYTKDLPLNVEVTYELNGKKVDPKKVVGASGDLKVTYRVKNMTAQKSSVTFDDGTGKQITEDVDVVIPMVGSLTTTVPANFTDVHSDQANIAGDGRGGTKLSFTMTLFPPIGTDTAEFGYTARIRDGVVPPASISALPVKPLQSPSFKAGAESYAGGADTGAQLTAGAVEIDTNLLKLRDGASELLAGLIQLRDGAEQLRSGLQGEAAPGARELANGASQAASGAGELASGTKKLDKGANDLASGSKELNAGAGKLAAGAATLDDKLGSYQDGLTKLHAGVSALPANPDYQRLLAGIDSLIAAIGAPDKPGTLRFGLASLKSGVTGQLQPGVQALIDGVTLLKSEIDSALESQIPVLHGLAATAKTKAVTAAVMSGCVGPPPELAPGPAAGSAVCVQLKDSYEAAGTLEVAIDSRPIPGVLPKGGLKQQLEAASAGLENRAPSKGDPGGVLFGLHSIQRGIDAHEPGKYGASDPGGMEYALNQMLVGTDAHQPGTYGKADRGGLLYGLSAVDAGVQQLVDGIVRTVVGSLGSPSSDPLTTLRGGAAALNAGAHDLSGGAKQLSGGTGKLTAGAGQLADGTGQLKDGAGKLADGNKKIADGAGKLANGLGDAADGSGQLADGLVQAADGAPQIVDGAQRLSTEGMGALTEAGKSTAQEFGSKYALIEAVNERAASDGMAYGAPEGANGLTAYSLELAGENGEGGRNMARGLGALAVFGLGAGLVTGVRNRFF